ncbi:MAG: Rdx family protein [Thermoflexales bacterium]|nr:Rdx family protein [Thermoflexales bacterium]
MAAEITKVLGVEPELIQGDNGIFDVVADGKLVFSKYTTGRFPTNDEIVERLRQ